MRQIFDTVTEVSLWLASQGFFMTLILVLIPYVLIAFPVQYWIRKLLKKHEFENNDFAYPMVAGILNGVTGLTIAFVVVTLWNHHREQDGILKKEAQAIENIHMDLRHDTGKMREAERALVLYVQTVATMEFNEETRQAGSEDAVKYLDEIYKICQSIKDPLVRAHAMSELANLSEFQASATVRHVSQPHTPGPVADGRDADDADHHQRDHVQFEKKRLYFGLHRVAGLRADPDARQPARISVPWAAVGFHRSALPLAAEI